MSLTTSGTIKGSNILIVDDHRNIRLSLKLTLEEEGANITEADSFKGGLAKLSGISKDNPPTYDAMLFDIRLGDGNGLGRDSQVIAVAGVGAAHLAVGSIDDHP